MSEILNAQKWGGLSTEVFAEVFVDEGFHHVVYLLAAGVELERVSWCGRVTEERSYAVVNIKEENGELIGG